MQGLITAGYKHTLIFIIFTYFIDNNSHYTGQVVCFYIENYIVIVFH